MSTRPILRTASSLSSSSSASATSTTAAARRRVHFAPATALVSSYPALPPSAYDRSAIVVQANPCALPPRHSRFYAPSEPHPSKCANLRASGSSEEDDDEPTTDESDTTPTPRPSSNAPTKRSSNTVAAKYKTTSSFSTPFADMACLQGF